MKTDHDLFLEEEAPAILIRLEVCRRMVHLLREAAEAARPEPNIRIIIDQKSEIISPTTGPFSVPVILSALIDIRKLCCFFGFSIDSAGAISSYRKRKGDFDIEDLGLPKPSQTEFLDVLKSENVSPTELQDAYVSTLTYANKALAHYKTGGLKTPIPMNFIVLSSFGIDRSIKNFVYARKSMPLPQLPITDI